MSRWTASTSRRVVVVAVATLATVILVAIALSFAIRRQVGTHSHSSYQRPATRSRGATAAPIVPSVYDRSAAVLSVDRSQPQPLCDDGKSRLRTEGKAIGDFAADRKLAEIDMTLTTILAGPSVL